MPDVRRGVSADLEQVAAIQALSPEAARWSVQDYLLYDLRVAVVEGRVVGFLVGCALGPGESEVLNLAVEPELRRKRVARALFEAWIRDHPGPVYLEVRESNLGARNFYKHLGFHEVARRCDYYSDPPEGAIVLKFHSC